MATKNLKNVETSMNGFGVKVKMCCASCIHKSVENDGTRICQLMQLKVKQGFGCSKWQMDVSCDKAGLGLGKEEEGLSDVRAGCPL